MSNEIINQSPDLQRLRTEGYEVSIVRSHLVIGNVPHVDSTGHIQRASLVCPLDLAGNRTSKPSDHVMRFTGSQPCNQDGTVIGGIVHGESHEAITPALVVQRSFSNKPKGGYPDYYEKVTRYVEILSAPAKSIDNKVDARTFQVLPSAEDDSPFVYPDTNTGRAHLDSAVRRFEGRKLGIIGLGGTGSYVLDLVSKTRVSLIRILDGDTFLRHNAFRAPGAASLDELTQGLKKVDYLKQVYSEMHKGIEAYADYVTEKNLPLLDDLGFVFICIDSGPSKKIIVDYLHERNIPFIDVGVGVQLIDDKLTGAVRVTASSVSCRSHIPKKISFGDGGEDIYATNIQIADLNMLNAALAVLKWKKIVGFYHDLKSEHDCGYMIECNALINDDFESRAA